MAIVKIDNKISVIPTTQKISKWANDNLILDNPDYLKKVRMGFWTGNTPRSLQLFEKEGQILHFPYGTYYSLLELVPKDYTILDLTLSDNRKHYQPITELYDYQETAIMGMIKHRCGILQAPAGSGKTQIGVGVIQKLAYKTLWITHTKDLLAQSKKRAERYFGKEGMGTITEGKVDIGDRITFATVQTLANIDLSHYKHTWGLIIVDEAHRCSGTPTAMTQFSKVLNSLSSKYKYGLTATVHRSDGLIRATYSLLGGVIHTITDEEVGDKIMQVGVQMVETGVGLERKALNTDGTLNYQRLISYLVAHKDRNNLIVSYLITNDLRPSLILSERVGHLENLYDNLPDSLKEKSAVISGSTPKGERERVLQEMRDGDKIYLFATYQLAKEGLDIPRLEQLYMATPQKDYAVVTQSIGRIARQFEGKLNPICFDFVDNIPYLIKSFKKRKTNYNKKGCYYL